MNVSNNLNLNPHLLRCFYINTYVGTTTSYWLPWMVLETKSVPLTDSFTSIWRDSRWWCIWQGCCSVTMVILWDHCLVSADDGGYWLPWMVLETKSVPLTDSFTSIWLNLRWWYICTGCHSVAIVVVWDHRLVSAGSGSYWLPWIMLKTRYPWFVDSISFLWMASR